VLRESGFNVARGTIATIEIGVEVKILHKAMISIPPIWAALRR
jgi:hypothetical protein